MSLQIVSAVKKEFAEKNKGENLPNFQKDKAQEMEFALEKFLVAVRHFSELRTDIDIAGIKKDIQSEVDSALR